MSENWVTKNFFWKKWSLKLMFLINEIQMQKNKLLFGHRKMTFSQQFSWSIVNFGQKCK